MKSEKEGAKSMHCLPSRRRKRRGRDYLFHVKWASHLSGRCPTRAESLTDDAHASIIAQKIGEVEEWRLSEFSKIYAPRLKTNLEK